MSAGRWLLPLAVLVLTTSAHAGDKRQFWKDQPAPQAARKAGVVDMPSLAPLVDAVSASVVNISTTRVVGGTGAGREWFFNNHPFLDKDTEMLTPSLGSGFVLTEDGYIVTNNHVVQDARDIRVRFTDGTELDARIVGRDPATDIALIKVQPKHALNAAALGDSSRHRRGDWVIAIGNPYGLENTVSVGIISAKQRRAGLVRLEDFIQTDASINPGNSGGPLFNLRGEVIGVNTAIVGDANGIGFAVPVNLAKEVLPDLKEHGRPIRGLLGVRVQRVTAEIASSLGLSSSQGALVAAVVPGSPADRAKIRAGDVITVFNGQPIGDMEELPRVVARTRPGSRADVVWVRDRTTQRARVKLDEFEEPGLAAARVTRHSGESPWGFSVGALNDRRRGELDVDRKVEGVVVLRVDDGSPADRSGLRPGDVIQKANRKDVTSPEELRERLADAPQARPVLLLVWRNGSTVFVPLQRG